MRRNIEFAQLFIKRIPITLTQSRWVGASIFIGVRIEQTALETKADAALQFRQRVFNRFARDLRQAADTKEQIREKLHLAIDDVVRLFDKPMHHPPRLKTRHHLERARRNKLTVRAMPEKHVEVSTRGHFHLVRGATDLVISHPDLAATMAAAVRQDTRLIGPEFSRSTHMSMAVNDQCSAPFESMGLKLSSIHSRLIVSALRRCKSHEVVMETTDRS